MATRGGGGGQGARERAKFSVLNKSRAFSSPLPPHITSVSVTTGDPPSLLLLLALLRLEPILPLLRVQEIRIAYGCDVGINFFSAVRVVVDALLPVTAGGAERATRG